MKPTTKLFILLLLSAPLFFSNCKKTDDQPGKPHPEEPLPCDTCLPPITTTGANTFGCRVNGKVWLTKDGWMTPAIYADYYNNSISIRGTNADKRERIGFALKIINDTGTFIFPNNLFEYSGAAFSFLDLPLDADYSSNPMDNGKIQFLRFDTVKGVFSGMFEFNVYSKDLKDTIHVTDGRFDIRK